MLLFYFIDYGHNKGTFQNNDNDPKLLFHSKEVGNILKNVLPDYSDMEFFLEKLDDFVYVGKFLGRQCKCIVNFFIQHFALSISTCTGSTKPRSRITKQKPHSSCFSIASVDKFSFTVLVAGMIMDSKSK